MTNLSDEEELFLREEKAYCVDHIKLLHRRLQRIVAVKNKYEFQVSALKFRHNQADRRLADFNKLTKVGKERKSAIVSDLEKVLKDPIKAKALMELLKEAKKDE